jgi:sugar phosphate isomerase/epimerase
MLLNGGIKRGHTMDRREFIGLASAVLAAQGMNPKSAFATSAPLKPMDLGLLIAPFSAPEERFRVLRDLGLTNCFLSLDGYIGGFTPAVVSQYRDLIAKYDIAVTTVEVVGPGPLEWNFLRGPTTIGVVPPKTRAVRIDALRQVSDFAKELGIGQVQTHCGFIPEDPADPLYPGAVEAIRTVAQHCHDNGQYFLMETGQETPTTMSRMIRDVAMPNLAVGLDTANLILYGKANPVDAVDILGPHVRQGRPLAHQPQRAWRGGAHRQGAGQLPRSFHQTASHRIYRRGHHRARDLRSAANRGRSPGEALSGAHPARSAGLLGTCSQRSHIWLDKKQPDMGHPDR